MPSIGRDSLDLMEIGVYTFGEAPVAGAAERLRNLIEEIELADEVGLDVFGVGEHHRPDFAASAPAVVLAGGSETHEAHPSDERGQRDQLGRSDPGVPG